MPFVEAGEEHLIGGRMIYDGPVYEQFSDALYVMNSWITDNIAASRSVKIGKVVSFKGWWIVWSESFLVSPHTLF